VSSLSLLCGAMMHSSTRGVVWWTRDWEYSVLRCSVFVGGRSGTLGVCHCLWWREGHRILESTGGLRAPEDQVSFVRKKPSNTSLSPTRRLLDDWSRSINLDFFRITRVWCSPKPRWGYGELKRTRLTHSFNSLKEYTGEPGSDISLYYWAPVVWILKISTG